jgi:hypothetical protein
MAGILAVAIHGSTVVAAMITFQFGGVVTSVDDRNGALGGTVNVGDPFSGTYTFDSDTPDSRPGDPEIAEYRGSNWSMATTIGGLALSASGEVNRIFIVDKDTGDSFSLGAFLFDSNGFRVFEFGVDMIDLTGSALTGDQLPLTPPDISAFQTRSLWLDARKEGVGDILVQGEVNVLTPEPQATLLFTTGLLGIIWLARARRAG